MLLVDNDVLFKLASWDLTDGALQVLAPGASVYLLPSARRKKWKPDQIAKYTQPGLDRVANFASLYPTMPVPSPAVAEQYVNIPDIDGGEALLFALARENDASVLWTGDKRCLRALALKPSLAAPLAGRVVCLEQVVLRLVQAGTYEDVRARICANRAADGAMQLVFGSGLLTERQAAEVGLTSCIQRLRLESGNLLVP